jgi:inorganic triphosphatase YgiF
MPPQAAPTEIELTLRLQPADVQKLIEAPELQALRAGPARERQLVSTYFDTADLALKRARVVIRVRRIGRRFVQTVKTAPSDTDAAITRGEWERQLKGAFPDLSGLADEPGLAAAFGDAGMALQLRCRARYRSRRDTGRRRERTVLRDRAGAQVRRHR